MAETMGESTQRNGLKVALYAATLPPYPCGVGKHAHFLANALQRAGNDVTVVTIISNQNATKGIFSLDASLGKFGISEYIRWAKQNRGKFDVVHLQYPTKLNQRGISVVLLPWILRFYGYKTAITLHELTEASLLGKIRNMVLAAGFSRIILPNPMDARWLFIKRKSLQHITLGPTLIGNTPKDLTLTKNSIGFLGFMDGSKGEGDLLRAISSLNIPAKVYFLSRFDPLNNKYHAELRNLTEELDISDMVEWVSPKDDQEIKDYLAAVDIVVMPFKRGVTRRNSTLLEAICAYKPLVVSDGGDLPEYLTDRVNALTFKLGNIEQLTAIIEDLCVNEKLRNELIENTKKMSTKFTWKSIAAQTVDVYRQ